MSILNGLTLRNLRLNKKRTIVSIIGIILSTALMVGIGLLFSSFQDYMIRETISYNGRYEVMYEDVSLDRINDLENKDFDYFYQKVIGFSEFGSVNEYKPYIYLTSVNKEYFEELDLINGTFPSSDSEIVISNHINSNGGASYKVGDSITLKYGKRVNNDETIWNNTSYQEGEYLSYIGEKTYKIVGIVERSNYEDYSASGYSTFTLDMDSDGKANLYVFFNKKRNITDKAKELGSKLDTSMIYYNSSLLALYGESNYGNVMESMIMMIVIMLSLVSIGCIIVIYNSFAISVMERKKEFGLLSSIGSTRRQLSYMVFFEALIVGSIGIVLGVFSAYIGIGAVIVIINKLIGDVLTLGLNLVTNTLFIVIPIIFMVIVIFISAIIPSRKASRVSPIEAIRQNDDIKINKKKIRTSKFTSRMFGIFGEIALKNIKRNKKKYRITIVSLFISIVLFISFSSYMNYTINTAGEAFGEVNYDYTIGYYDDGSGNLEEIDNKIEEIITSGNVKKYISYGTDSVPMISNYNYSKEYKEFYKSAYGDLEYLNSDYKYISIIVLDDNSYNDFKKELGLSTDKIILVNRFKGVSYSEDKRVNYDIPVIDDSKGYLKICNFNNVSEDEINNNINKYCTKNINNIYITDKENDLMNNIYYTDDIKLVVNKKMYDVIFESGIDYTQYNIISDNVSNIDKLTKDFDSYDNVNYYNVKEEYRQTNNMILVIKILMYGFIGLVTLIGVTSVFNTISTSMALRKREFAVLRSIGLTKGGFNKILFFESLFFGIKSLIYAIPVGIGITILIHMSLSDLLMTDSIIIPWSSIGISIVSVFVIVLLTMMYSTSKIKKHNIIEQIREENI